MSSGWVSIYRKIFQNPILEPKGKFTKMEAWLYLLCRANHSDGKVVIKENLCRFKRGQVITSQQKLMATFKWGNTKVINFLKLLQEDEMIELKTTGLGTMITICNYDTYQDNQNQNKVQTKSSQSAGKVKTNTMNKKNKKNNVNKIKRTTDLRNEVYSEKNINKYGKEMIEEFYLFYSEPTQDGKKMKFQTFDTWSTAGRLATWSKKDFNGYFKAHKDELFRKNQNKPDPVDESQIDPQGLIDYVAGLSKKIGRS